MDLDWDLAEENLAREEAMLWRCEHEVRLRCDGLTPLEARELRKCSMCACLAVQWSARKRALKSVTVFVTCCKKIMILGLTDKDDGH